MAESYETSSWTSLQIQLNAYFAALIENPSGVETLADLIAFDNANPELEEPTNFTDQSQYDLPPSAICMF